MKMAATEIEVKELAERGREIYRERLKDILELDNKGKFVSIEVDSGDYFIGFSIKEAVKKAEEKYPDKVFYTIRIGYKAAISFKNWGNYDTRFYFGRDKPLCLSLQNSRDFFICGVALATKQKVIHRLSTFLKVSQGNFRECG